MKEEEVYEHIRHIKEIVVDNGQSALIPKSVLHQLILFSACLSLLNFGITPEVFALEALGIGYKIMLTVFIAFVTCYVFYRYILNQVLHENTRVGRPYSKNQRFIGEIYLLITTLGVLMSSTVLIFGTFSTIYFYWTVLIGIMYFILGHFTLNIIKVFGRLLTYIGLLLILAAAFYCSANGLHYAVHVLETEKLVMDMGRIAATVLCGIGQLILWGYLKKYDV